MKFYLCDDEEEQLKIYRKKLQHLAAKYNTLLEINSFDSGEKMLFQLEEEMEKVDAIYLDINMPELDGISVAEKLQEMEFPGELIFLTVSKEHFMSAFDVGAFNYIVKTDRNEDRFELIFLRVLAMVNEKDKEYILLTGGGENKKVAVDEIEYFEVQKRIVTVFYRNGEFSFPSTIGKIENHLHGKGFLRVHRGFLVNINAIQSFTYTDLIMRNGTMIPIGRTYQSTVNRIIRDYVGEESAIS